MLNIVSPAVNSDIFINNFDKIYFENKIENNKNDNKEDNKKDNDFKNILQYTPNYKQNKDNMIFEIFNNEIPNKRKTITRGNYGFNIVKKQRYETKPLVDCVCAGSGCRYCW